MINRNFLIICKDETIVGSIAELLESFDSVSNTYELDNDHNFFLSEKKIRVKSAVDYSHALKQIEECYDSLLSFSVVFVDLNIFDDSFLSFSETIFAKYPKLYVVVSGSDDDNIIANWEFADQTAGRIIFLKPQASPAVIAYSLFVLSDKFNLQKILAHTERMNMIASMTAGLIHDFNNVITGIAVSTELLKMHISEKYNIKNHEVYDNISLIERSVKQGTKLLHSILSVAKTDDSAPSYININQELERIILLCNNILDKCIGFSFKPYGFEPPILYMPATSFEQLIMNLVVNAAHSMTFMRDMNENIGGVVTISVKSVIIPEKNQHHWTPGKYFKIDVIDEGVGIDTHKLKYIFDPFYTSKPEGKGTGIGLAAVKDILNRQKGYIDVESDVGKGTVFSVYLPALKGNA